MNEPLKELCGLTKTQFDRFAQAARNTYQIIGNDLAAEGPLGQDELIEGICDADYLDRYGETRAFARDTPSDWPQFYKTVVDPMISAHYDTPVFMKMMRTIFPHRRYS